MSTHILKHSPLVMALVDVRFTTIPMNKIHEGLESFKSSLFDLGFPIFHDSELNQVEAQPSKNGSLEFKSHKSQRLDFLSLKRNQSVILTTDSLCFRTTSYEHFDSFKASWSKIVDAFFESFPQLSNAGMLRMGLRYMDAFLPQENDTYTDYISDEWISQRHRKSDQKTLNSFRQQMETDCGVIRLELEERVPDKGTVEIFPRDIQDPEHVSVSVQIKDVWKTAAPHKYALLDIDHFWVSDESELQEISKEVIHNTLDSLHGHSSEIFWDILSNYAEEVWEKKKIGGSE